MNNLRHSDDLYKPYPYTYRYYRRQVPYDCKAPVAAPIVRRQLGPEAVYNYKVPVEVMYVPKRVIPSDCNFRAVPSTSCVKRYYNEAEDYNIRYQQYYQNIEGGTGGEGDAEDNLSCYNMEYTGSDKEEDAESYDYDEPYVVKPKTLMKPTPYSPPDLPKISPKPRNVYDNYNRKVTDYNTYIQNQGPPYYQRPLDFEQYKSKNDISRIPKPNYPKDENEVEKPLSSETFGKSRVTIPSQPKSNLDQSTQTLEFKILSGTISTQTELPEKFIPNSDTNFDPEALPPKDSRRNLFKKKFNSTLPVLESRLESPVRRLRKF